MVTNTAAKMAGNLSHTILNSDDPQTVADGAPAYLLLVDSFLLDAKDNPSLYQSAATLYGAYASVFVTKPERAKRMSEKSLTYAEKALCLTDKKLCHLRQSDFKIFSNHAQNISQSNIDSWYVLGSSWAGWIKANGGSMAAIADLPKVSLIMERIITTDENWQQGQAHLYLGVLKSILPPALGGKPEQARYHFERAIKLSNDKNLMAKVLFAEKYARLIFDQSLHDQLLNEVLDADPYVNDLTLMNTLAQKKAPELLDSSSDYF